MLRPLMIAATLAIGVVLSTNLDAQEKSKPEPPPPPATSQLQQPPVLVGEKDAGQPKIPLPPPPPKKPAPPPPPPLKPKKVV